MTKQDIVHMYGKSVYQIRLEVAERLYGVPDYDALSALAVADEFVNALKAEDIDALREKF